ncbi:MAG TPA: flagellar basal body-associated FliL family protein [Thermodesulfovibrio thiophilus]|nr:flagellar basal body-associated FliL family protein [Thermodesulfovibrio thiophilus]
MAKEKTAKLEEEQSDTQQEKPKKKRKFSLIIIIAVIVLAVGAAGAYLLLVKGSTDKKGIIAKDSKNAITVNFALEPFVVNLMDQSGSKYLKVSIQIELSDARLLESAKNKTPQIRDIIITLLTNKTSDELITPEGKLLLKDEIKQRINQILGDNSVVNVYLTDFVMQ